MARINIRSFATSIVFSAYSCYRCTVPFDAKSPYMWASDMHQRGTKSRFHEEELDVFVAELMGAVGMLLMLHKEQGEADLVLGLTERYIRSRKWTPELEYALKTRFDSMLYSSTKGKVAAAVLEALSAIRSKRALSD